MVTSTGASDDTKRHDIEQDTLRESIPLYAL